MSLLTDSIKSYGEGDTSTNRAYYKNAAKICSRLITLEVPLNSRLAIEYVRHQIEEIVKKQQAFDKDNTPKEQKRFGTS
jgi:hypothetical protein